MTRIGVNAAAAAALSGLFLATAWGVGPAVAQDAPVTQESPLATEPLPAQGPGQAATGSAVTGSAPSAGQMPSPMDNSEQQGGVLLQPGPGADDMGAAAGKGPPGTGEPSQGQ